MDAKRNSRAKMNIPMCVACVLLCLTMFTTHLMSGLYARYVATGEGSDSARVATFGDVTIVETGSFVDGEAVVTPGVPLTKDAKVLYSGSEVAVYIFLEVDVSKNWEIDNNCNFSIIRNGSMYMNWIINWTDWNFLEITETTSSKKIVYYQILEPNKALAMDEEAKLANPEESQAPEIIMNNGKINVGVNWTTSELETILEDTFIDFRATAVQAGGFNGAKEAWDSVSVK